MTKILMLVSSAKVIRAADGTPQITGYFVEEAIKPYDRFIAAGAEVVVTTADGQTPHPDPYGLEPFFHYPDEDEDFLASVTCAGPLLRAHVPLASGDSDLNSSPYNPPLTGTRQAASPDG